MANRHASLHSTTVNKPSNAMQNLQNFLMQILLMQQTGRKEDADITMQQYKMNLDRRKLLLDEAKEFGYTPERLKELKELKDFKPILPERTFFGTPKSKDGILSKIFGGGQKVAPMQTPVAPTMPTTPEIAPPIDITREADILAGRQEVTEQQEKELVPKNFQYFLERVQEETPTSGKTIDELRALPATERKRIMEEDKSIQAFQRQEASKRFADYKKTQKEKETTLLPKPAAIIQDIKQDSETKKWWIVDRNEITGATKKVRPATPREVQEKVEKKPEDKVDKRMEQIVQDAKLRLEKAPGGEFDVNDLQTAGLSVGEIKSLDKAAELGTGTWASMAAAFDAVAGGLGFDRVFGMDGFFPETQKARIALRTTRQLAKAALLTSARGAIWEQIKVEDLFPNPDMLWRNPRTEVQKLPKLRTLLNQALTEINQDIASGILDAVQTRKHVESRREIEKLLNLIGTGQPSAQMPKGLTDEDRSLIDKHRSQ